MATSLTLYDLTSASILRDYLPMFSLAGTTLPNSTALGTGGEYLSKAAAEVADALAEGGFGEAPTCSSTSNVRAYWAIRTLIGELAAVYFSDAHRHLFDQEATSKAAGRVRAELDKIRKGGPVGELTVEDSPKAGQFRHGDDDRDDLNDRRFSMTDEL